MAKAAFALMALDWGGELCEPWPFIAPLYRGMVYLCAAQQNAMLCSRLIRQICFGKNLNRGDSLLAEHIPLRRILLKLAEARPPEVAKPRG
jgi:hypothetical protein